MGLLCIDRLRDDGNWQKRWLTLSANSQVCEPENWEKDLQELEKARRGDSIILIIAHGSVIDRETLSQRLPTISRTACAMLVRAGGTVGNHALDGRTHQSGISFGTDQPLGHLVKPLKQLLEDLTEASRQQKQTPADAFDSRLRAWAAWEESARPQEFATAIAILCQGYLAAYTGEDSAPDIPPGNEQVYSLWEEALQGMGWTKLFQSDSPAKQLICTSLAGQRVKVDKPSWWARVFEHRRPDVETLNRELGTAQHQKVDSLLGCIWSGANVLPDDYLIEPKTVAEAYLELARLLSENKP